jgi:hypothetical protein
MPVCLRFAAHLYLYLCLALFALPCRAQNGRVEDLGPLVDSAVPSAVRQTLDTKGYRVLIDDAVVCELWFEKNLAVQSGKDIQGVIFPQLAESTLVGVLHFPRTSTDFRGQAIPAGFYTLRYELLPEDGNHLGVAPNRDFLLLIPADTDTDPTATFKFQQLVGMSRKATGTKHPGPLSLAQTDRGGLPMVSKDDQEHWTFSTLVKLSSGEQLPLGLVVKGIAQQ